MAIKKVLATNVEQGGWLGRVVETDKGEKVFLQGRKIRAGDNPTPSNFSSKAKQPQVTPAAAGNISQQQGSSLTRNLPQFTQVLQQALDEAGKQRQATMAGQAFSELGGVPGSAASIVNMIKQSVGPDVEQVFTGTLGAVSRQAELEQREREFQMRLRGQNIDLLSNLAESGVVSEMPNSALQSMAQKAGISSDTALAWKARIMEADKRGEEDRALEKEKIRAEIAALGRRNRDSGDEGSINTKEEAELVNLAMDNLSEDDATILNSLGTKQLKKQWLINKGRGVKEEETPTTFNDLFSAGINAVLGIENDRRSPALKQNEIGDVDYEDL